MSTSPTNRVLQHLRRAVLCDGAGPADGELLVSFIERRDEAALAALVVRHGPMVWGTCRRLLGHHDAEDAFQATFLVLVKKATSIVPREMVGNWLYGVAHQTALQARRAAARRGAREVHLPQMPDAEAAPQDPCSDVGPLLDQELSRLPGDYRAVLVLCDLESRTRKEVARQLGVPEGTVAGRLARARAMLAKRLTRRGVTLSGGALAAVLAPNGTSAGVPDSVVSSTIGAAKLVAAGQAATAGAISARAAALTEGVLQAMLPSKWTFAAGLAFALTGLLIAGVSVGLRGGQQPKTAPPPRPAPPPAPEPKEDVPAWKKEFRKAYGLADGEVLKRVAPPFPACRTEYLKSEPNLAHLLQHPPHCLTFRVHQKETKGELQLWGLALHASVHGVLLTAAGVPHAEVEGERDLLATVIDGDFVFRHEASVEGRVAALERILRDECKLSVRLTLKEVEREVIVARGKLQVKPLQGQPRGHVAVYARELTKEATTGRSGLLHDFLDDLQGFVGRRIVNESTSGAGERISFGFHTRWPKLIAPSPGSLPGPGDEPATDADVNRWNEDHDPALVLPNVARQAGLRFTSEKRKVRALFVQKRLAGDFAGRRAEAAAPPARADDPAADRKALEGAGIATDEAGLLDFFEKQTASDAQRRRIARLIEQLGADRFDVREKATSELMILGSAARTALQKAGNHNDQEIVRRARLCLEFVDNGGHRDLLICAARVLSARKSAKAVAVLLAFLPDASASGVEEDVIRAVTAIAVSEARAHPALVRALADQSPVRRAAAAEALARADLANHAEAVRKLLKDADASVRLRVSLALVWGGDRKVVPVLIDVLPDLTRDQAWQVDDVLYRLGGAKAPPLPDWGDVAARKQYRDECLAWWKEHGVKADLTVLQGGPHQKAKLIVRASHTWGIHGPNQVTDGNPHTVWNAGEHAGAWIEVDLGAVRPLGGLQMVAHQSPDGPTTHEVWVSAAPIGDDRSRAKLAHTFKGQTRIGEVLRTAFPKGLTGRYVQVRTTESPSWVAWAEIELGVR